MKTTRTFLLMIISVALFNACKKKTLPEPEEGNAPQFYFKGNVNGTDINLEAGVNNYYMFSSYEQSATTNVYTFGASLKEEGCANCLNSISIEINDHRTSALSGPSGIDSAFQSTFYPFYAGNPAPVSYYMSFYSLFNNTPQTYLWNFGDGETDNAPNPSHIFKHAGEYNVSLTVTDNNSCSNSVGNIQKLGIGGNYCNTTISGSSTSTLNATFTNSTIGTPPYNFYWNFGDGSPVSTSSNPVHTYTTLGRYPVSLTVVDATGESANANFNYLTPSDTSCTTNYLVLTNYGLPNPQALSNITVKWKDSNGTEYSSNDILQPSTSYFKILSAADYHENDWGQKTKKLHIKFKCTVYNGTNSIQINNAEAVVVVAYK